ncbi:P12 family lipoprotein [Borrelia turicatae]|uniref:Lipoprotein n=1 Tax=Borrelia turicatae (strain 91E135) TaxID=314724 RepID=A0ABF7R0E7_BORT9|nr:P12 family lipoprotein [Borrelia turicatae]ASJ27805.1 putative lipoprotein [Borrelia turicatae 91E135]UPA14273.1 P12 family lipoprotein [Borrelia turicatae 91E135]UPA14326.1 P12 family lipoprotein [Borrelia turicatae 91E135]
MKKSTLVVCMLILLCLLSCDINAFNELLDKTRERFLEGNKLEENKECEKEQEGQLDVLKNKLEGGVQQVVQEKPLAPVNNAIPVFKYPQQVYPYYVQEEIDIKEEDITPNTKYEKAAQAEIEKIKRALGDYEFDQLIEDALKLKNECDRLESSFYGALSELNNKIGSYPRDNNGKRQKLIQFRDQLNGKRFDINRLTSRIGGELLSELSSAMVFFDLAQKTLKESITERLKNKYKSYRLSRNSDFLAQKSRSDAENSLEQLESSVPKLNESKGKKKEIEELVQGAKSFLRSLHR